MKSENDSDATGSSDPFAAQPFLREQLGISGDRAADARGRAKAQPKRVDLDNLQPKSARSAARGARRGELAARASQLRLTRRFGVDEVLRSLVDHGAPAIPETDLPVDIRESLKLTRPQFGRFHGAKFSLGYFPSRDVFSRCADTFGYMTSAAVRNASKLPVDAPTRALLAELGDLMGNSGRETAPDSATPAGYTYVGQFVDHDITLDVSSALDSPTEIDARVINNMRSPALDLDSVYGKGPALDTFLYESPRGGEPDSAFRLLLGSNSPAGPGGPGGMAGGGGMIVQSHFDVPRTSMQTAIIGDPRNNENLIVSQFHHAMLRFHNANVDMLLLAGFPGDIFIEAKRRTTLHYQWAVLHDFLPRICGQAAVDASIASVTDPGRGFRMPVEFSVGAYRFGHSMIRSRYWLNFNFINQPMEDVFRFIHQPLLPVLSNWVIDFNAFFDTGIPVPVNNKARKIDSVLASALEDLDGNGMTTELMGVLAARNLLRGLVMGLPSGQATAAALGVSALTPAELTSGLPADEVAVLNKQGGILLSKTPLWYYVLREAMVKSNGEHLGPLGAKIVADTFVKILRRDAQSILNVPFAPSLPSANPGTFTFADLVNVAGVTVP